MVFKSADFVPAHKGCVVFCGIPSRRLVVLVECVAMITNRARHGKDPGSKLMVDGGH